MKIAIAADTADADASISIHAARAPCYLVFTDDGTLVDTIMNPHTNAERGAAPRAAQLLMEHDVEMLVAGDFGERFIDVLRDHNISTVVAQGTASRAIQEVVNHS